LKNKNSILPLSVNKLKNKKIAVLGDDAHDLIVSEGEGSYFITNLLIFQK
jgi:hypothetical protein